MQRRIAQLIQSDNFYTEQEQDNFDNIDLIAIREALAERGIVNGQVVDAEANRNSPFVRQVMSDVERIAQQQETIADHSQEYRLLDRLRADCEYFLGAGARAEKHLWAGNVHAQIAKLRELYDALPENRNG